MSGPNINRPVVGSNAIGSFQIGVSQIGDVTPGFDFWSTIISQYANSPILTTLISNFSAYVDPTQNLQSFYDQVWNVLTATGYGLDLWGRIVGVTRVLSVGLPAKYFGFQEGGTVNYDEFGQSPFYSGASVSSNFSLTDAAFRMLILAKAFSNISNGSSQSINALLRTLFPNRGNCYVIDNGDMTMVYAFNFFLAPVELSIVANSGVLPKPSGVSVTIQQPI